PLSERVALITGGARGLGLAIAKTFAHAGASVVVVDVDDSSCAKAKRELHEITTCATAISADITAAHAPETLIEKTLETFGRLDILVNNAARFLYANILDISADDWHQTVALNLSTPFFFSQAAAKQFHAQGGGGNIINIASVHGTVGDGFLVPQCASKSGVIGLTKSMAEA